MRNLLKRLGTDPLPRLLALIAGAVLVVLLAALLGSQLRPPRQTTKVQCTTGQVLQAQQVAGGGWLLTILDMPGDVVDSVPMTVPPTVALCLRRPAFVQAAPSEEQPTRSSDARLQ